MCLEIHVSNSVKLSIHSEVILFQMLLKTTDLTICTIFFKKNMKFFFFKQYGLNLRKTKKTNGLYFEY